MSLRQNVTKLKIAIALSSQEGVFLVLKVKASSTVVLQSNLTIMFQTHCIRPWMLFSTKKHFIFGNGRAH